MRFGSDSHYFTKIPRYFITITPPYATQNSCTTSGVDAKDTNNSHHQQLPIKAEVFFNSVVEKCFIV